jgi:hypothetical protein
MSVSLFPSFLLSQSQFTAPRPQILHSIKGQIPSSICELNLRFCVYVPIRSKVAFHFHSIGQIVTLELGLGVFVPQQHLSFGFASGNSRQYGSIEAPWCCKQPPICCHRLCEGCCMRWKASTLYVLFPVQIDLRMIHLFACDKPSEAESSHCIIYYIRNSNHNSRVMCYASLIKLVCMCYLKTQDLSKA